MTRAQHVDPTTGRRIRQPYRENRDYAKATMRFVRGLGRRAGLDPDALLDLQAVALEADYQLHAAVADLRTQGYSWTDVGRRLDMTRQSAQERFGAKRNTTPPAARRAAPHTVTAAAPNLPRRPVGTGR